MILLFSLQYGVNLKHEVNFYIVYVILNIE